VDLLDDAGADGIDTVFVEADDERRHGAPFGDEIAADQIVLEGAPPDLVRVAALQAIEQRPDVQAVRYGLDDRRRGQAVHPLHRLHALDVAGDLLDEAEGLAREDRRRRVRLERDDQRPGAAELLAVALVIPIDRVLS
jgi:hypothetical protein